MIDTEHTYCKKKYTTLRDRKNIFSVFGDVLSNWIDDLMDKWNEDHMESKIGKFEHILFFIVYAIPILFVLIYYTIFHFVIQKRVTLFSKGKRYVYTVDEQRIYNGNKRKFENCEVFFVYRNGRQSNPNVSFTKIQFDKYFSDAKELRKMKLDKINGTT